MSDCIRIGMISENDMRRFRFLLIVLVSLMAYRTTASSQTGRFVFSNINVEDGLSDNSVKCIYRDNRGFMWFGTSSGLNRFDGYNFEIFRNDPRNPSSLSDNVINVIEGSVSGDIWIGTRNGISILDHETFIFRRVFLELPVPATCQDINYITALACIPDGNFLAGTHNGLFLLNENGETLNHILFDRRSCSSQLNSVTKISPDGSGNFWIGTEAGFVFHYRPGSASLEKIEIPGIRNKSAISAILRLKGSRLLVGTQSGLHLYDVNLHARDISFTDRIGKDFDNIQVTGIEQDSGGRIWVSTDGAGSFVFDSPDDEPENIRSLPYAAGSLSGNGVISLYCDNKGIVWMGNSRKGVDFYKDGIVKFRVLRNYPIDPGSLSNNDVNCIAGDWHGNIWIGTNGGGLNRYDRAKRRFTRYTTANGLSSDIIVSVYESSDGLIWAGTYMGGLNALDPATGRVKVYRHDDLDSASLSDDRVWGIKEDRSGDIWVATLTSGLNRLDRKTGKFRRYNSGNSSICFDFLNSINIDRNGYLWLSSANGLIWFDPENNRSECFYSIPGNDSTLSDNQVISTFEDSRGLFWVCTNEGLNLMDRKSKTFRVFTEADGLPSPSVLRMLEDKDSCLWVSTRNGVSKIVVSRNKLNSSPEFYFLKYGVKDGLQGKEFSETAAYRTDDGEIWFGGSNGVNAFYPGEIRTDDIVPQIVITGLRIDNIPVKYRDTVNKRVLLETPIFNSGKIVLKYRENSFTVDFAALNYFFPEATTYSYNLDGFNEKWINTDGRQNYATFSNINNGSYVLRVRGTNSDGIWNEVPATLQIRILPPYWKSWYSYLFYTVLIFGLLALLRHITLSQERMKMELEQEQIRSRHLNEIDALKTRLFTNISHELRTPLTLIMSPAGKLKSALQGKPEEKQLNTIIQNAKRLLFMVNQLLDFRKMEVQGFVFNPSAGDIVGFIRQCVFEFEDLAGQKKIHLDFSSPAGEIITSFDKPKLEKIIFNLLSNSLKFTHSDGLITVSVNHNAETTVDGQPSELTVTVEDNGIGIPATKISSLFRSYYQADQSVADTGTGLGLALVKEFVGLHGGDIKVESEAGKGSKFTITFPVKPLGEVQSLPGEPPVAAERKNDMPEKPRIFIAEDDDDLRFYLKDNLKNNYEIFEASNGNEAFDAVSKVIPDLLISDIYMPGMNGTELCKKVKAGKTTSQIPVILLTGRAREEVQCAGLAAGADDCLTKPFNFQLLEARISNLIGSRKRLREFYRSHPEIQPADIRITSLDEQFLEKVLELVERNMSKTDYTVEEMSNDMGLSRTLLYKKMLALTGKPPLEFIRSLRLKRAAQLLLKSQLNVSEIAFRVGFNDPKYFRKHFKNEFGMLPSKYVEKAESGKILPD